MNLDKKKMIISIGLITFAIIGFVLLKQIFSPSEASVSVGVTISEDFLVNNIDLLNSQLEKKVDTTNPYYLAEIVDENGDVPASQYYTETQLNSRSIKELKAYDGKIFMGLGDWDANTGPVKIIYYDPEKDKIETSGTIADEAVEAFELIDGNLYTTGRDPRDGWGTGSYYVYNKGTNLWDKYAHNTGWIHVFDIEKYHDKLFMCGSTVDTMERSQIQVSNDNGKTFEDVKIVFSDGTQLPYDSNLRFYSFFNYFDSLYARMYQSSSDYNGIYKYDEESNQFNYVGNSIPFSYPYGNSTTGIIGPINNKLFYVPNVMFNNTFIYISGNYIYKANAFSNSNLYFQKIQTGNNYSVQDAVVYGDTLYLLSNYYNDDKSFNVRIYSTKDLDSFDLIYEFTTDSFPYSMEYYEDKIYIGTSYHKNVKDPSTAGTLYNIDLSKIKDNLSLQKENKIINITADGITYPINYKLNSKYLTFETTLSFDKDMTQKEWEQEFLKVENLDLIYTVASNKNNIDLDNSVTYYNDVLYSKITTFSNDYSNAIELAKDKFSEELSILDDRFTITTENVNVTEDKYEILVTLTINNLDYLTSEKYIVNENENYVYVADDSEIETIKNNLTALEIVDLDIDLTNNKINIKYNDEVIRYYNLVGFSTDNKISKGHIYVGSLTEEEILSKINERNCDKYISENKLVIKYNGKVLDEYSLIRITFEKLTFIENDKIYVGTKTDYEVNNSIKVINGEGIISNGKIEVIKDDNTFGVYELLSIDFGKYIENDKKIIIPENLNYNEFKNNITLSNGINCKIFKDDIELVEGIIEDNMTLKIYYNDMEIDSYNVNYEYLNFLEPIKVNENNKHLSNIYIDTTTEGFLSKIDTSGDVMIKNSENEIITGNEKMGTGMNILIKLIDSSLEYKIIVSGDVDGNSNLDLTDINLIANFIYNDESSLSDIYLNAADYNNDNNYDLQDIMKIANKLYKGGN